MSTIRYFKTTAATLLLTLASACGGGGSSDSTGNNEVDQSSTVGSVDTSIGKRILFTDPLPLTPNQPSLYGSNQQLSAVYGSDPAQRIVLREAPATVAPRGLIVGLHGGGWLFGAPEDLHDLLEPARLAGWTIATVGYRLSRTEVVNGVKTAVNAWPAARNDAVAALAAIESGGCTGCTNAEVWSRLRSAAQEGIMVMGVSAGGALALDAGHAYLNTRTASRLMCIGSVVGVVDIRPLSSYPGPDLVEMGLRYAGYDSGLGSLSQASPAAQLESLLWNRAATVKLALAIADNDAIVPFSTYDRFLTKLEALNIPRSLRIEPGLAPGEGHSISNSQYQSMVDWTRASCFEQWIPNQLATRSLAAATSEISR